MTPNPQSQPASQDAKTKTPAIGGGLPLVQYWAEKTLSPDGPRLWETLLHRSACLSCSWGTGGQKGGFTNEVGETLQRCMKSVEANISEIQPAVPAQFFDTHTIAQLQQLSSLEADRLGRWSHPVIRRAGSDYFERISWQEIFAIAKKAFQALPERIASYSSGRGSNEAAFILQLMMRTLGSNNLADCSDLCHAPSTAGLLETLGTKTSVVSLESLQQADCVVLAGSNAAYNHPRLLNELIKLRHERGGQIIVINPVREKGLVKFGSPAFPVKSLIPGSEIASLYLQPIPGSDAALFSGIQKALLEQDYASLDFLKDHTEGWEAVFAHLQALSWDEIISICGVSQAEIESAAEIIGRSPRVVFGWAMGITQQLNGVDNVCNIVNTALISGQIGRMGAGVMPVRGHSNVQGFGSMGVTVNLKQELKQALEKLLGRSLELPKGFHTRDMLDAAEAGKVDALVCVGGNLYGANPDLAQAKRALGEIDTIFYLATKPNIGHFHGLAKTNTIIIPVLNRFENPHKTTVESGNNYVRLNDEGKTHLKNADLISEVEFLTTLAYHLLGDDPIDWRKLQDTRYVRQLISQAIPGYEKIGVIDETKEEFTIGGRIFTEPQFKTPSGKAQMRPIPLPSLTLPNPTALGVAESTTAIVLSLITGRSYSQHNTIVYKIGDKYRGMPHRNCILVNSLDAQSISLAEGERVVVKGDTGQLENVELVYGDIREGAALMFYPEVNAIFKASCEPRTGTPAFKRVPVAIYSM